MVIGTSTGFSMATDFDRHGRYRGRVRREWESIRRKHQQTPEKGLTGRALEAAVMGVALADPSLVKIEART